MVAGYELAGVHGDNEEIWNQFKEQWQEKLNNEAQAMVILSTTCVNDEEKLTKTDLTIIEKERISSLVFSSEDSDILWSDDGKQSPVRNMTYQQLLDEKCELIYQMLNGRELPIEKPKPKNPFQKATKKTNVKIDDPREYELLPSPNKHRDVIKVNDPLLSLFVFYRFYIQQPKYKAITKTELQHEKYMQRRDELRDFANLEDNKVYLTGALANFIAP